MQAQPQSPVILDVRQFSPAYDLNMGKNLDRFVQILQGRRKESLSDVAFWTFVGQVAFNEDIYADKKHVSSRLKILFESIAAYLISLISMQKEKRNLEEVVVMLEGSHLGACKLDSSFDKALESGGVYKAFKDYILNHSPEDDIAFMSLAIGMLIGYRYKYCQGYFTDDSVVDHKERYVTSLAKCAQASAELHPFLRRGLAFAAPLMIMAHLPHDVDMLFHRNLLLAADDISKLIIKHGLATFVLRELTITEGDPAEIKHQKVGVLLTLVRLSDFCPSFVDVYRTDLGMDCVVSCLLQLASVRPLVELYIGAFCENFRSCLLTFGSRDFQAKFVPRLVKHLPDDFLIQLYKKPEWFRDTYLQAFEPAMGLLQVGRFNAHQELAHVIINMFKEDEIRLMRHTWDFLHEAYAVPRFKEEYFKNVQGCDKITLEIIRSVISTHWVPLDPSVVDKFHLMSIVLQELRMPRQNRAQTQAFELEFDACPRCHAQTFFQGKCSRIVCRFIDSASSQKGKIRYYDFEVDFRAVIAQKSSNERSTVKIMDNKGKTATQTLNLEKSKDLADGSVKTASRASTNEKEEDASLMMMSCHACGRHGEDLMLCGRCLQVRYCNRDCQRADWKKGHKQACQSSTSN